MAPWKTALLKVVIGFAASSRYLRWGMERTAGGMACTTRKCKFMINRIVLNSDLKSLKKQ